MEINGGRPKKETTGFEKEKPLVISKKNLMNNENVNDNDNDNDNDNENVIGDSCVDGLSEIIKFYNENIGLITPYGIETFTDYSKEMPSDLIIYAMQISVEANKKTIQYIKAILNNWHKSGIKTLIQAKSENKKEKKKTKTTNFEQREYENLGFLYKNLDE